MSRVLIWKGHSWSRLLWILRLVTFPIYTCETTVNQKYAQSPSLLTRMGLGLQWTQAMTMTCQSMCSMLVHMFLEEEVQEEQQRKEGKQEEDELAANG